MQEKNIKAFSLIELSIVILVIGLLIAGVSQSSNLIEKYKIYSARSLTTNSPVGSIKDLMLWYETSLEKSFSTSEAVDEELISSWNDINPQSIAKINAIQNTPDARPTFVKNVVNGLPVVRFNGNDFLNFQADALNGSDFTIFLVEQRASQLSADGDVRSSVLPNFNYLRHTGLGAEYVEYFSGSVGALYFPVANFSSKILRIHSFLFSKTAGLSYYVSNGYISASRSNSSKTTPLSSLGQEAIGAQDGSVRFYLGDIAEIIIYTRTLKTEERESIESYLGQKYKIKIFETVII